MRTQRINATSSLLILEPGDTLRCDGDEIPVLIEMGMRYTLTIKEGQR
jgi:hypothetical protein